MRVFIAGLSFVIGLGVMSVATPTSKPPAIPDGYYDLSELPDEIAEKFADPAYLQLIIKQEEMRANLMAEKTANATTRIAKKIPDRMPALLEGLVLFEPDNTMHWPTFVDPSLQTEFDNAKSDWVIVNYWASWCAPCIAELPDIERAASTLSEFGVRLLPLNADPQGADTLATVDQIYQKRTVTTLPKLITAGDDISIALAAAGMSRQRTTLPFNIIYAPDGEPYAYFTGIPVTSGNQDFWSSDQMLRFFEALSRLE
ncbi:MAG: TlpA disulfide reductase family protein [Pseudomonadota bacterium]